MIGVLFWLVLALTCLAIWVVLDFTDLDTGAIFLIGCGGVLVGGLLLGLWFLQTECRNIAEQTRIATEWRPIGGCFIEVDNGSSVPVDERSIGLILRELAD